MKQMGRILIVFALVLTLMPAQAAAASEDYLSIILGRQEKQSWQYKDGKALEKVDGDRISTTQNSVIIVSEEIAAASATVYFGGQEDPLANRDDYKIKREDDQVIITFTKTFLKSQKPGKYNVYIEFSDYSAEVPFVREDTEGYYSAEPPRTKVK